MSSNRGIAKNVKVYSCTQSFEPRMNDFEQNSQDEQSSSELTPRALRALLATALDHNPHPLLIASRKGDLVFANPAARRIRAALAQEMRDILPMEHLHLIETVLGAERNHREIGQRRIGQHRFDWQYKATGNDPNLVFVFGAYRNEPLRSHLSYDQVTGLIDRNHYLHRLNEILAEIKKKPDGTQRIATLLVDINRFRNITESFGHRYGDSLLVEIAQRLLCCVYAGDTVARLGGGQFLILLEHEHSTLDPVKTAQRIQKVLSNSYRLGSHVLHSSASIGIVEPNTGYESADEIIRDAQAAAHEASATSPTDRCVMFTPEMRHRAVAKMQIVAEIRSALDDRGFRPFFQPIVSLATSQVVGFEALARWMHPLRGIVEPVEFIPAAESSNLVIQIDMQVFKGACRYACQWNNNSERSFLMSVNLSARDFLHAELLRDVATCIQSSGISPDMLRLEITESALIDDPTHAQQILKQLKGLGVRIAIDDFGTGYSSLGYLSRFPIDALKIDRSFVQDLGSPGKPTKIVAAILALAKSIGVEVIAEGVESLQQRDILLGLGCDYAQGYLWSPAVDHARAESMVQRNEPLSLSSLRSSLPASPVP